MPAKKRDVRVTPAKRKTAPAKARGARATSASAAAKPSKAARSSAVSALSKPRRSFDTRVIGIGVVCVLIVMTLGAARRHPPTEAEIAKIVDSALKDPKANVVTVPDDDTEWPAAEPERTPAPSRVKPAAQPPALAPTQPLRAAAMTTASTRPEMVAPVAIESKPAAVPAAVVERPAQAPVAAAAAPAASPVTVSGCLTESKDGFVLKKAAGDAVSKSRSWKSGFLKKSSASIDLVDEANVLRASFVGRRVETTGVLEDGEMQVRSMRVGGPCE